MFASIFMLKRVWGTVSCSPRSHGLLFSHSYKLYVVSVLAKGAGTFAQDCMSISKQYLPMGLLLLLARAETLFLSASPTILGCRNRRQMVAEAAWRSGVRPDLGTS